MSAQASLDELIAAVDRAVQDTLSYFAGPGRTTSARIDAWGAWDVLAHFAYWHEATAWGIASVSGGGQPWQLPGGADEINDACLVLRQGDSFDELVADLRRAHVRLMRAAGAAQDLDAPAFRCQNGETISVRQRLETIARHWDGHLRALREAGA